MKIRKSILLSSSGSVLILTLWALSLLTIYAVHLGGIVRQKIMMMERLDSRSRLHFIAEAGVQRAFAEIRKIDTTTTYDALNESWSLNESAFKNVSIGDGGYDVFYERSDGQQTWVQYGMSDEESKVNLNKASVDIVARLLTLQGDLESDAALRLAYAIVDWRDNDSFFQHPQYGAEDDDYKSLSLPYEAKDADFESVDELLLVRGMTPETFAKIRNFVTVYSEGSVNINTVSPAVLSVYGLSDAMISRIMAFRRGQDFKEGTADDGFFRNSSEIVSAVSQSAGLSAGDLSELSQFVEQVNPVTVSDYFCVHSVAHLTSRQQQLTIDAVVGRKGQVLSWRETYGTFQHGG